MQQFLGQALDLVGEGRREQQVLSTRRQFGQYATDVMDKAHIQHTVRFVQHEDFNFIKTDGVLMFKIQQTARGGDDNMRGMLQGISLGAKGLPAAEHQNLDVRQAARQAAQLAGIIFLCILISSWR